MVLGVPILKHSRVCIQMIFSTKLTNQKQINCTLNVPRMQKMDSLHSPKFQQWGGGSWIWDGVGLLA